MSYGFSWTELGRMSPSEIKELIIPELELLNANRKKGDNNDNDKN
jgi:hypothetical protein